MLHELPPHVIEAKLLTHELNEIAHPLNKKYIKNDK